MMITLKPEWRKEEASRLTRGSFVAGFVTSMQIVQAMEVNGHLSVRSHDTHRSVVVLDYFSTGVGLSFGRSGTTAPRGHQAEIG